MLNPYPLHDPVGPRLQRQRWERSDDGDGDAAPFDFFADRCAATIA
jgi:hypothetical protein